MIDIAQLLVTVPAITATVQWAKAVFKISGRWSQLAAVIIGMIFTLAAAAMTYHGGLDVHGVLRSLCEGFLYGLAAAGFYDLANGNLRGGDHAGTGGTGDADSAASDGRDTDMELALDGLLDPNTGLEARRGKHEA